MYVKARRSENNEITPFCLAFSEITTYEKFSIREIDFCAFREQFL